MTVRGKLVAGLGIVLLMVLAMSAVGVWNTVRSVQLINDLGTNSSGAVQLATAQDALWHLRYGVQQYVLFTEKGARDKIVADERRWYKVIDDNLATFKKDKRSTEELTALLKLEDVFKKYKAARPRWFELYGEWKLEEAAEWQSKNTAPLGAATIAALSELIQLQQKAANTLEKDTMGQVAALRMILIALVIFTIAVLLLVFFLTIRAISVPLNKALGLANQVAAGDLTANIAVTSSDEFGKLLSTLKTMNENLTRMVQDIRGGAESIRNAAEEVAAGNANLSQRTEEQAATLEQTASSMEALTATVRNNTQSADKANALAKQADLVAAQGGKVVGAVVVTMNEIQESSKKIGDIIGVIDSIAFQTNILALNAAVEAARAGEQGRGFAVVASEVRALAQRSADAAKEIKTLIGDSMQKVEAGTRQVENAGKTMGEIVGSVQKVTVIIDEISSASREQASGIEQVNKAVGQMDQVVQQNAAVVEQAAAAAETMQANAQQLVQAVSVFKLSTMAAPADVPPARRQALRQTAPEAPMHSAAPRIAQSRRGIAPPAATGEPYKARTPPSQTSDGDWKEF